MPGLVLCFLLLVAVCFASDCSSARAITSSLALGNTTIVITGGDTGIGLLTSTALAYANASVLIATHNYEHGMTVVRNLTSATGNPRIWAIGLDLSNFSSVHSFASRVLAQQRAVDVLINNAGIDHSPAFLSPVTADGFERVYQTNYLGHFLLTELLLPALRRSKAGKVINVASGAAYSGCSWASRSSGCMASAAEWDTNVHTPNGTDCNSNNPDCPVCCKTVNGTEYNSKGAPTSNYALTKFSNVVHAAHLALREYSVKAYSVRPGFVATAMTSNMPLSTKQAWCSPQPVQPGVCPITADHGAATQTFLAVTPIGALKNGQLYSECQVTKQPESPGWDWSSSPARYFNASVQWTSSLNNP